MSGRSSRALRRRLRANAVVGLTDDDDDGPPRSADLLVGTLGARVVNMVMTLATFARLCAVSSAVRATAYDASAWEGLTLHLHRLWHPARHAIFDRLLQTWRLLEVLYLRYAEANRLDNRLCCPVVGVWNFQDEVGFPAGNIDPIWLPQIFFSSDVVRSGVRLDFNVRFRGRMPSFDVGWSSTWDLDHLLDDIASDAPTHSFVRFRIAHADSPLAPEADRSRWYNHDAMSDDVAIRLPRRTGSPDARVCLRIGLIFADASMTVYINGHRWSADVEPRFSHEWSRHLVRYAIIAISNEPTFRDLTLEPLPARFL